MGKEGDGAGAALLAESEDRLTALLERVRSKTHAEGSEGM